MLKEHVKLTDTEREALTALLAKGRLKAKTLQQARALLEPDRSKALHAVAATLSKPPIVHSQPRSNEAHAGERRKLENDDQH